MKMRTALVKMLSPETHLHVELELQKYLAPKGALVFWRLWFQGPDFTEKRISPVLGYPFPSFQPFAYFSILRETFEIV